MPSGAHTAAAIRVGSLSRRAIHQPATSSPANTTSPYPAYKVSGPCSHGVDRANPLTAKNNDVLRSNSGSLPDAAAAVRDSELVQGLENPVGELGEPFLAMLELLTGLGRRRRTEHVPGREVPMPAA